MTTSGINIYQAGSQAIEVRVDVGLETLRLSQRQLAELFDKEVRTEHLKDTHKEQELEEGAIIQKFQIVQTEGQRQVKRKVEHDNLDAAISVGYRVNSKKAHNCAFGQCKQHLVAGYTSKADNQFKGT